MEFHEKKAIYLQIADYISEMILKKHWNAGDKVPSIRELAIEISVNPNTVTRTYAYLEEQQIIEMQRGIGYFVALKASGKILALYRKEFLEKDLPQVFRTMKLLNINFDELKKLYSKEIQS